MAGFALGGGFQGSIGWRVTALTFDAAPVKRALDSVEYHALRWFGADVRHDARKYLKRGRSPWGDAPDSEGGYGLLRRFVLYGFDRAHGSVVIGPKLLSGTAVGRGVYAGFTVPELLEQGGRVRMTDRSAGRLGVPAGTRAQYDAMPYMGPAFENRLDRQDKYWQDSLKRYA